MKIVFDNFKTVQTAVRARELNPRWDDSFSFAYSTRYADCLARKFCVFEVYDHNNFSANALIGHAKVDLHTLATGCAAQELVVRDGRILTDAPQVPHDAVADLAATPEQAA